MEKKNIVISTDMDEMGVSVTIDKKSITKHFEVDMPKAIEKLLATFGVSRDEFNIKDCR